MDDFKDLNEILNVQEPTALQIQSWKQALKQRQLGTVVTLMPLWTQWAVAASIGFVIGLTAMAKVPHEIDNKSQDSATIETVYTNLQ